MSVQNLFSHLRDHLSSFKHQLVVGVLNLAGHEVLVLLVAVEDDLDGLVDAETLLIVAELVLSFTIVGLVHAEPLEDFLQGTGVLLLQSVLISDAVLFRVGGLKCDEFPVQLALVDEAQSTDDLQLRELETLHVTRRKVDNIQRVVVTGAASALVRVVRILPRLRHHAVVEIRREAIVPQNVLLAVGSLAEILDDWVALARSLDLHLRSSLARDFDQSLEHILLRVAPRPQRDIVPRRDVLAVGHQVKAFATGHLLLGQHA